MTKSNLRVSESVLVDTDISVNWRKQHLASRNPGIHRSYDQAISPEVAKLFASPIVQRKINQVVENKPFTTKVHVRMRVEEDGSLSIKEKGKDTWIKIISADELEGEIQEPLETIAQEAQNAYRALYPREEEASASLDSSRVTSTPPHCCGHHSYRERDQEIGALKEQVRQLRREIEAVSRRPEPPSPAVTTSRPKALTSLDPTLRAQNETLRRQEATIQDLIRQLEQATRAHEEALASLSAEHAEALDAAQHTHEEERLRLQASFENRFKRMNLELAEQQGAFDCEQEAHEEELARLRAEYSEALEAAQHTHEEKRLRLQASFENRFKRMNLELAEQQGAFDCEQEAHEEELARLRAEYSEALEAAQHTHEEERLRLQATFDDRLKHLSLEFAEQQGAFDREQEAHTEALARLSAKHTEAAKKARREHERIVHELKEQLAGEPERLRVALHAQEQRFAQLQNQFEAFSRAASGKLDSLQAQLEKTEAALERAQEEKEAAESLRAENRELLESMAALSKQLGAPFDPTNLEASRERMIAAARDWQEATALAQKTAEAAARSVEEGSQPSSSSASSTTETSSAGDPLQSPDRLTAGLRSQTVPITLPSRTADEKERRFVFAMSRDALLLSEVPVRKVFQTAEGKGAIAESALIRTFPTKHIAEGVVRKANTISRQAQGFASNKQHRRLNALIYRNNNFGDYLARVQEYLSTQEAPLRHIEDLELQLQRLSIEKRILLQRGIETTEDKETAQHIQASIEAIQRERGDHLERLFIGLIDAMRQHGERRVSPATQQLATGRGFDQFGKELTTYLLVYNDLDASYFKNGDRRQGFIDECPRVEGFFNAVNEISTHLAHLFQKVELV